MNVDLIPMEFNVIVELDKVEEKTVGGIILPGSKIDREKLEAEEGTLVAVAKHAFTYADWEDGDRRPTVGDRVLIARFAGVLRERDGKSLKIVKDKDIIAIVETQRAGYEAKAVNLDEKQLEQIREFQASAAR